VNASVKTQEQLSIILKPKQDEISHRPMDIMRINAVRMEKYLLFKRALQYGYLEAFALLESSSVIREVGRRREKFS
jgi:hypothetical protein